MPSVRNFYFFIIICEQAKNTGTTTMENINKSVMKPKKDSDNNTNNIFIRTIQEQKKGKTKRNYRKQKLYQININLGSTRNHLNLFLMRKKTYL